MPAFANLNTDAGLAALNDYLKKRSYIEGYQVSSADIEAFSSIASKPDAAKFPFASRWFSHISQLPAYIIAAIPKPAPAPAAASSKAAAKDEDDIDLFGDEDEEDEEAHEAMLKQKAAEAAAKKKPKEAVIAKSSLLIDVKPWDDTTDMKALEESVRSIQMDGLIWGQSKLIPVAYGVKKLQINAVIVDDLVSTDDLEEKITAFEDYVQSMDIAAFNKI